MRPNIFLVDEPCKKAKEIIRSVCSIDNGAMTDLVYTQLTPITTKLAVFCPCTSVEHIQSPYIVHLDNIWKQTEGHKITSTAEHTWSLILQLAKLNRLQLSGKTIGIIGYGRIGQQIKKYADAFGMRCQIKDVYKCYFGDVYNCDVITIHVPLNESTKGMIGKEQFELMKPGTLLVNTSRAEIVDIDSLMEALTDGNLNGYADDFYNGRRILHPRDKIIQTPHIGGNCIEAREATDIYIANKIVEYVKERYQ